jgi:hypothetical protein
MVRYTCGNAYRTRDSQPFSYAALAVGGKNSCTIQYDIRKKSMTLKIKINLKSSNFDHLLNFEPVFSKIL